MEEGKKREELALLALAVLLFDYAAHVIVQVERLMKMKMPRKGAPSGSIVQ